MWKVLTADQLREADRYTISHEPVSSLLLMERAAAACVHWMITHLAMADTVRVFCGPGNNGGDGLAIARLLSQKGIRVVCYTFGPIEIRSDDARHNLARLVECPGLEHVSLHGAALPQAIDGSDEVWVDALFGTGLNRRVEGLYGSVIDSINGSNAKVVAVDMPSGLKADTLPDSGDRIVKAHHTLTFATPKFTFFFAVTGAFTGQWVVLDIGLDKQFINGLPCQRFAMDETGVLALMKPRPRFSHKGTYGHGLLVAGSKGMNGAAVLASGAALRSGIGLLTVRGPACAEVILQSVVPEALFLADANAEHISGNPPALASYKAVGVGPGIGMHSATAGFLHSLIAACNVPLVMDADALNLLSQNKAWLPMLKPGTVLTPHPKEFERLAGSFEDEADRHEAQRVFSKTYSVVVVLKGAHTCISLPDGSVFFNTSGNQGLARGGSGDVLTGMILAFLAQGYAPAEAAMMAVYIHGRAADSLLPESSLHSMLPEDLIAALPNVFRGFERLAN